VKATGGLRVGWGELTFDVDPSWGGSDFGPVTAITSSPDGHVYVCHRSRPAVLILDSTGKRVGALGEGEVTDPHGITTDAHGNVYVADRDRHVVWIFDSQGRLDGELGTRDQAAPEAPFNHPAAAAVADDGTIFVADGYGNSRVHVFAPDRRHLSSWGTPGRGPSQFRVPHGIAVDADRRVYVTDRENDRVQVFDASGGLLSVWEDFKGPTDVCIDRQQRVIVTDHVPRVTVLDASGRVLATMRAYHDTHGVCCDAQGNIYVASTSGRAVIKYSPVDR